MEHIFPTFIFYNIFFYVRNITITKNLFILALKTTWVRKLFRTECKWDNILFSTINQEKLFNFGNGYISYIKENVVTVIFPMTVRFLFDHILISFFICKILSL
jgi:hypothetical protein